MKSQHLDIGLWHWKGAGACTGAAVLIYGGAHVGGGQNGRDDGRGGGGGRLAALEATAQDLHGGYFRSLISCEEVEPQKPENAKSVN